LFPLLEAADRPATGRKALVERQRQDARTRSLEDEVTTLRSLRDTEETEIANLRERFYWDSAKEEDC
jgi:hypothetical protein